MPILSLVAVPLMVNDPEKKDGKFPSAMTVDIAEPCHAAATFDEETKELTNDKEPIWLEPVIKFIAKAFAPFSTDQTFVVAIRP